MRQMKVPLKKMQIPKGSRSHRCYGKKLVSLLRSIGLTAAHPPPDVLTLGLLSSLPELCFWPGFQQRLVWLWFSPPGICLGTRRFEQ